MAESYRLISFTTAGTARLAANWLESVRLCGLDDRAWIYCLDEPSERALGHLLSVTDSAAHVVAYRPVVGCGDLPKVAVNWGTRPFVSVMLAKLSLLLERSNPDSFVPFLFCDADTVLITDPSTELEVTREINLAPWFQSDRDDYEKPTAANRQFCMGCFYCARPAKALWQCAFKWLLDRLPEVVERTDGDFLSDQAAVNAALEYFCLEPPVLDQHRWINGARRWPTPEEVDAFDCEVRLVHANWTIGVQAKEARFVAAGLWHLSPDTLRTVGL